MNQTFDRSGPPPPFPLREILEALSRDMDPRRLGRGLTGHRRGAVRSLWFGPGWIGGEIQGRDPQPARPELWWEQGRLGSACPCVDEAPHCAHLAALAAAALEAARERPEEIAARLRGTPRPLPAGPPDWLEFWGPDEAPDAPEAAPGDPGKGLRGPGPPLAEAPAGATGAPEDVALHLEQAPPLSDDLPLSEVVLPLYPALRGFEEAGESFREEPGSPSPVPATSEGSPPARG